MCSRPFSGDEKNFYLYVYPTPADLSDSDIRQIFSVYGQIKRIELHRVFIRDEAVDGHCFIEFEDSDSALKALEFEKINSGWENTSWKNVFAFKKSLRKTDLDTRRKKIKET